VELVAGFAFSNDGVTAGVVLLRAPAEDVRSVGWREGGQDLKVHGRSQPCIE
jgi:hypothetical protein